jgi:predicted NAD/FAD-dependent oxidoreductase
VSAVDRERSVTVLGGGVSGLTYAWTLQSLGFRRVRVLERGPSVGGKSCTVSIEGRPHDLGATMGVPLDYDNVQRIAARSGIRARPFPRETHFDLRTGGRRARSRRRDLPRVLYQTGKYALLHAVAWRGVDGSGLENASPELHASWADVARARGCEQVSDRFRTYLTGYGYGFADEVPAAMYANLIRAKTLRGLASAPNIMWEGGTQPIWQGLARELDVTTGFEVKEVRRKDDGVTIHGVGADGPRTLTCDDVVLAFDAKAALGTLDATPDETTAFAAIRTYPYATFAAKVRGLSDGSAGVGYLEENMRRDRMGRPMAWVKRYADHDVFVFHLFAPPEQSNEAIDDKIAADVRALGGEVTQVCERRRWSFFPHYAPSDFGQVRAVARRQGRRRTVVVGEAFSFSSMARVAEHAERTARRFAAGELGGGG